MSTTTEALDRIRLCLGPDYSYSEQLHDDIATIRAALEELDAALTAIHLGAAHLRPGDRKVCSYMHDGCICNKCGYVVPKDSRDAKIERLQAKLERVERENYQTLRAFTWLLYQHGPVEISHAAIVRMSSNMEIMRDDKPDAIRFAAREALSGGEEGGEHGVR